MYVTKNRSILGTYEELKKKYDINKKAAVEKGGLISRLQTELEQFTPEKDWWRNPTSVSSNWKRSP